MKAKSNYFDQNYSQLCSVGFYSARKYYRYTYLSPNDLVQEGLLTVWETIRSRSYCTPSFLRDRCRSGVFSAYKRGRSVDNHFQNTNRRRHPSYTVSIEGIQNIIADKKATPEEAAIDNLMFQQFFQELTTIQQLFLQLLMEGYFCKEIIQKLHLSARRAKESFQGIKAVFLEIYNIGADQNDRTYESVSVAKRPSPRSSLCSDCSSLV